MSLAGLRRLVADMIFPKSCLSCGEEGEWLCGACRGDQAIVPKKICPVCKNPTAGACCISARLDALYVLSSYHEGSTDKIIKQLKYGYSEDIVEEIMAERLAIFFDRFAAELPSSLILGPLPLHYRKRLERGFNQAELLADELSRISGWRVENDLIKRIKYNKQQARLTGSKRKENVRGIFQVDERRISGNWGEAILLVDDVYTTGSTMGEAAEVLKNAGFSRIFGLAAAVN